MEPVKKRRVIREQSLIMPEVQNPFTHRLHLTTWHKIQIAFMTVTVFPIRLLLISFFLVLAWILASIALYGRTAEDLKKPLSGWRRGLRPFVVWACRMVYFSGGFHWITTRGQRVTSDIAPICTVAPHSSYFDSLPVVFLNLTTIVAKSTAEHIPIFGKLTAYTQPVFVHREDPNSRQNTIKEIKTRAKSGGAWPQIIIFPEGTCTNRTCLISFKPGAFIPGVPVQPVCLKYTNEMDTITWTWDGPGAFRLLWYTLCQFNNKLEVEYMPVYTPNKEEQENPKLFGENVRKKMAKCLGVPVTDHTFEDCRLMAYAAKLNLPGAAYLVEFQKISKKLGLNYDNLKELLDNFLKIAQENKEHLTKQQFADHLGVPVTEQLTEMFELYDRDGSGTIDFREYVIGLHLIAQPANTEETIQFAFQLFDKGAKGYITQAELGEMLFNAFGMEDDEIGTLFAQVDQDQDDKITFVEFKAYAEEKPEYAHLFKAYNMDMEEAKKKSVSKTTVHSNGTAVPTVSFSDTHAKNVSPSASETKIKDE